MHTEVMCVLLSFLPGAIELSVFSEHYKVELDVVDIQTQRIDRFGTQVMSANLISTFYVFVYRHPFGDCTTGECRALWGECEQAACILATEARMRYQKFSEMKIVVAT